LDALYRRAGVVVSPLRVGSGLKVKLVEAMGWGKAVVATPITAQGVGPIVRDAIVIADQPEDFAREVLDLMTNELRRRHYAEAALRVAKTHFGEDACYNEILSFICERGLTQRRTGNAAASHWAAAAAKPVAVANSGSTIGV